MGYVAILGGRYRKKRLDAGFSVVDVSVKTGISASQLYHFEYGLGLPSYDVLTLLCLAVGIPVSDIVTDKWRYVGNSDVIQTETKCA